MRRRTIGERNRRFTLELPLETPDGFGGVLRSYQPGPQVWCSLELLTAAERIQAGQRGERTAYRVTMPFREGVTADARISLGIRRFRIRQADDPDGRRRELVCLVEEMAS